MGELRKPCSYSLSKFRDFADGGEIEKERNNILHAKTGSALPMKVKFNK